MHSDRRGACFTGRQAVTGNALVGLTFLKNYFVCLFDTKQLNYDRQQEEGQVAFIEKIERYYR